MRSAPWSRRCAIRRHGAIDRRAARGLAGGRIRGPCPRPAAVPRSAPASVTGSPSLALPSVPLVTASPKPTRPRESGDPDLFSLARLRRDWVPAFAGMSGCVGTRQPPAFPRAVPLRAMIVRPFPVRPGGRPRLFSSFPVRPGGRPRLFCPGRTFRSSSPLGAPRQKPEGWRALDKRPVAPGWFPGRKWRFPSARRGDFRHFAFCAPDARPPRGGSPDPSGNFAGRRVAPCPAGGHP